jgi:hypothetical protein
MVNVEWVHGVHSRTRAEAAQAIVEYIGDCNTERLHSSLGYPTPSEFERRGAPGTNDVGHRRNEAARVAHRRLWPCSNDTTPTAGRGQRLFRIVASIKREPPQNSRIATCGSVPVAIKIRIISRSPSLSIAAASTDVRLP